MAYSVELGNRARKDFEALDGSNEKRVRERLAQLAQNPFDNRISKKLINMRGTRSSRVGDWRIIYHVEPGKEKIIVAFIEQRGQVYKRI